jgi:hypothetical protein
MSFPKPVNLFGQSCQISTEIRTRCRQMPQLMQMDAKKPLGTRFQSLLTATRELSVASTAEQHPKLM